jgi:glycine/D-amino acid oxidase-like deaminating enzyme
VRVCIIGGGLAGALLAWRLAQLPGAGPVELRAGRAPDAIDATAASGGAVKAFEGHARQRELATRSMAELLASPVLREWSGYRQASFVSLRAGKDGLADAVAGIDAALPGSTELVDGDDLPRGDWALPGPRTAVIEHHAGYTRPGRWRDMVLADSAARGVSIVDGPVHAIAARPDGTLTCDSGSYDTVVLATGAWTPQLLRDNGFSDDGYRSKSIQYALHTTGAWRPPSFSDEVTGLYARPTADGGLLLGLPAQNWDVDPGDPPLDAELLARAAGEVAAVLPRLRLGPATSRVASADCYRAEPVLALSAVTGTERLFTFTGGAGGSVKTALAASREAAATLAEAAHPPPSPQA